MKNLSRKPLISILAVAMMASASLSLAGPGGKGECKTATKSCCKKGAKASVKKAGGSCSTKKAAAKKTAGTTVGAASMKVVIDKETGELRAPNAEELKVMAAQDRAGNLNESSEGLEVVTHPDGTKSIDLQGRFMSDSVAKVAADGTIVTGCVSSEKEKKAFFQSKPTPKAAPKE